MILNDELVKEIMEFLRAEIADYMNGRITEPDVIRRFLIANQLLGALERSYNQ